MSETLPDWVTKRVHEICDLGRGRVISQEEIQRHPGVYSVFSSQSKDEGVFGSLETYDFDGNYVTWTTDGANAGTVFFRSGKFNCTNVCGTLKPKSLETSARFLARALSTVTKRHVSYVGNPKLMNNIMAAIQLRMPPRPEQDSIAAVLDTVDDAIAKLKQVRAGLLHDLLTRGLDENGQLRDPLTHPEQFQDSQLGRIPREWRCDVLGNLVSADRPIVYGILMPGRGYPDGIPVIKVKDIKDGKIDSSDLLLTDPRIDEAYRRSRVSVGDLLFTIRGTVGRMAFVPPELEAANITQDTARISLRDTNPLFIARWLEMPIPTRFIEVHTIGVAVKGINLGDVRRIPVIVPPKLEQDQIAKLFASHEEIILTTSKELACLVALKSGLMNDLLTGRVRVPEGIAVTG